MGGAKSQTITSPRLSRRSVARGQRTLVAVWPRGLSCQIALSKLPLVVGRGEGEGQLPHGTISREHAELTLDAEGALHVRDLDSRNGTSADGVLVEGAARVVEHVLRLGDVVLVLDAEPEREPAEPVDREAVFGESAAIVRTRRAVAGVAGELAPVLLLGQTGVGKEMIAREIHRLSGRKGAFVAINAAELSPQLVESQLFGHQKGAFTGAVDSGAGLFRAAHGGTLFLDEIGELNAESQPKLLRAIQEREVRAVGATRTDAVDVRVVAATHVDLPGEVEAGRFRRDLYARLALFELQVPPLSARRRDIVAWIDRLSARRAHALGRVWIAPELETPAVERLLLHDWPENLRGLDMLVHRLSLSDTGPITVGDLEPLLGRGRASARASAPPSSIPPGSVPPEPGASARAKPPPPRTREELKAVLERHEGSVRAVAGYYARDRRQIYRWLDAFDLRGVRDEE
jgi:DNA-binding NtrC family response regulator